MKVTHLKYKEAKKSNGGKVETVSHLMESVVLLVGDRSMLGRMLTLVKDTMSLQTFSTLFR